jgi:WD40 repeat protein
MGCSSGSTYKKSDELSVVKTKLEQAENLGELNEKLKILNEVESILMRIDGNASNDLKIKCHLKQAETYFKQLNRKQAKLYLDKAKALGSKEAETQLEKFKKDDISSQAKYFVTEEGIEIFFEYTGIINLNNTREFNWVYEKASNDIEMKSVLDMLRNQIGQEYIRKEIPNESETKEILELFKTDVDGNFSTVFLHKFAKDLNPNLYNPQIFIFIGKILKYTQFKTNMPEQLLNDLLKLTFANNKNIRYNDSDLIFRLEAISILLGVMADLNLKDIPKEHHDEFYNILCEIINQSENYKIKFLANYTKQALVRVPNDESKMQSFFRRFVKLVEGVNNIRGAVNDKDPSKILDAWSCFKESFDFQQSAEIWYDELKYAQFLINCKNFKLFEQFLLKTEVETKKNLNFSIGIIYEIIGIVQNEEICIKNKEGSLQLLFDILISPNWNLSEETKIEIIQMINYYQNLNTFVYDSLKKLLTENDELKNIFSVHVTSDTYSDDNFNFQARLIDEAKESLTKNPDFCKVLIRQSRLMNYESQENLKFNLLYTPARCVIPEVKPDKSDLQPLMKVVEENYLKSSCKMMVIVGDSGSGKSMFLEYLENQLLKKKSDYFPIYIKLPQYIKDFDSEKLFKNYLGDNKMQGLSHLIEKEKILFLLDGYDEIPRQRNIYDFNNFKKFNKNSKVIITCREEILLPDFRAHKYEFVPDDNEKLLFEPRKIEKFSKEEIEHFLDSFLNNKNKFNDEESNQILMTKSEYLNLFKKLNLNELISNPLTLYIVTDVLPAMISENIKVSLFNLYQTFVNKMIRKEIRRKDEFQKSLREFEINSNIKTEDDRIMLRFRIARSLAVIIYQNKDNIFIENNKIFDCLISQYKIPDSSKCKYAILRSLPLKSTGNNYFSFAHKSLYEFFLSNQIIEEIKKGVSESDIINLKSIETAVLKYLESCVKNDRRLEKDLWSIVEKTRETEKLNWAGSNAISVLNFSKIIFKNKNLEGSNIPFADLSNSVILNCNFNNSNLNYANFTSSYIANSTFDGSNMSEVSFSQYPNKTYNDFNVMALKYLKDELIIVLNHKLIKVYKESEETLQLDPFKTVALSKDGKLLLTVSITDQSLNIYNILSNEKVRTVSNEEAINYIEFSPDSSTFASIGEYGLIKIWDTKSGALLYQIEESPEKIHFNPDGLSLVSVIEKQMNIWDLTSGNKLMCLKPEDEEDIIISICFSEDGSLLSALHDAYRIRIWKTKTGKCEKLIFEECPWTECMAFSPDNSYFVCANKDETIRLWDLKSESFQILEGHSEFVNQLVFSPDGSLLASADYDNSIRLWDVKSGLDINEFQAHKGFITYLVFSLDGSMLASSDRNNTIHFWSLKKSDSRRENPIHYKGISCVTPSHDNSFFVSGGDDYSLKQWNPITGELLKDIQSVHERKKITCLDSNFNGSMFAAGTNDSKFLIWNTQSEDSIKEIKCQNVITVSAIKFSSDGKYLAVGFIEFLIRLLNLSEKGNDGKDLIKHDGAVECLAFSPDGKILISGGDDCKVLMWNTEKKELLKELNHHSSCVFDVSFNPNNTSFASGDNVNRIIVCDIDGNLKFDNSEHLGIISVLSYNKTGSLLASACWNGSLILSDSETGQTLHNLKGHLERIQSVVFMEGTDFLISGSEDRTIRFWDIKTGNLVHLFNTIGFKFCLQNNFIYSWNEMTISLIKVNNKNPSASEYLWIKGKFPLILTNSSFKNCKLEHNNQKLIEQILYERDIYNQEKKE